MFLGKYDRGHHWGATSVSVDFSLAGASVGDFVLCMLTEETGGAIATPSGFTRYITQGIGLHVWGGTWAGGAVSCDTTHNIDSQIHLMAFRNVVLDSVRAASNQNFSSNNPFPSVTPPAGAGFLIGMRAWYRDDASIPYPANMPNDGQTIYGKPNTIQWTCNGHFFIRPWTFTGASVTPGAGGGTSHWHDQGTIGFRLSTAWERHGWNTSESPLRY